MRSVFARWAWWLVLLGGCDGCDDVPADLRVDGPHPYVHCAAADPPEPREWQVGDTGLTIEGRMLRVEPAVWPVRIAAFSGPGFSETPPEPAVAKAAAARPDLMLVLGGIGDTPAIAKRVLTGLAKHEVPSLVVAGGRDAWDVVREAFDALDGKARARVIDATRLRSLIIHDNRLHFVAGAVDGRYARSDDACGVPSQALVERDVVSLGNSRDWLVAWEAPRDREARGVATTGAGLKVGSETLTSFADELGAAGGLFATPYFQVMRPFTTDGARMRVGQASAGLNLVVPRLAGPVMERSDGSRVAPGFALVELGDEGLKLLAGPSEAAEG